jgi:hypothetical protein
MKLRYFHLAVFPFSTIYLVITPMRAELRLTSVITDHAVLQSDAPIHTVGRGLTGGEDHAIHLHHCQGGWTESTNECPHAGPEVPNDPVRSSLDHLPVSVFPPLPMLLRRQNRPHGSHRYLAQVSRRRTGSPPLY